MKLALVAATALLVTAPTGPPAVVAAPGAATAAWLSGTGPSAVVTTADRARLLAPLEIRRSLGGDDAEVVDVELTLSPADRYQQMVGFGASITESSATVLRSLPGASRAGLMAELFAPDGLRLSVLRQPIGGSEFVAGTHYTLDDTDGTPDPDLRRFSIRRDQVAVLPLVRKAVELSGSMTIIGSPWSAPAWMKTSSALIGGSLRSTPEAEGAFARYLARFVRAYGSQGVPIAYLTVQNEPKYLPKDYPGMAMEPAQQARVVNRLAAALAAQGSDTQILGLDHNWADGQYVDALLAGPAAGALGGIAYHCYAGTPSAMAAVAARTPGGVFLTECSGSFTLGDSIARRFSDTLDWQARNLVVNSIRAGSRTVVTWNLALDPNGGPRLGGCSTCTAVVTVDPSTGAVTRNAEYYVLGHLSRYVAPGAVRIGLDGVGGGVDGVAFRNPDGSSAVVLYSSARSDTSVSLRLGDALYTFTAPGRGLVSIGIP